ncbi:pectate lyase family protein [Streptomyces sp. 4N509B]|uniref:pectate lyase family protein n=1 Tax=Streptomyces sp. 4N509B TaxID=3457413 RepID=UPI003FD44976
MRALAGVAGLVAALTAGLLTAPAGAADAVGAGAGAGGTGGQGPRAGQPVGWAATEGGTTGGAGASESSIHVVETRAELAAAFQNGGEPEAPKIIYVRGAINGHEAADGTLLDEQDYAPGWDLERFMACYGPEGTEWSDSRYEWCGDMRRLRTTGSNAEKRQIQLEIPSNTTLVGIGDDAQLLGVYLSVRLGENIIVRNLHFEAPVDYFPSWDPWDGEHGSWNARFDALSLVTGSRIWIDHCTFTDGRFPNDEAPVGFHGQPVERHDGLLDIEDGSDLVTVSYSRFLDHSKTMLIGSGDGNADTDRGRLRVTLHHNLFEDSQQRSPRVRFGRVHAYNNYFVGSTQDPGYPMVSEEMGGSDYFLGMGLESQIVSEYNAFHHTGPGASPDVILDNLNGHLFRDHGSWFSDSPSWRPERVNVNGIAERKFEEASAEAIAAAEQAGTEPPVWATREFSTDVGWQPSDVYRYTPQRSSHAVRAIVLTQSGAGVLPITAP